MSQARSSAEMTTAALRPRALRPLARLASSVLEPLFYWLDMTSPDGSPSNSKIVYTAAALVSLFTILHMGLEIGRRGGDVPLGFTVYASAVLLFCGSFDAFKRWTNRLAGGGNGGAPLTPTPGSTTTPADP